MESNRSLQQFKQSLNDCYVSISPFGVSKRKSKNPKCTEYAAVFADAFKLALRETTKLTRPDGLSRGHSTPWRPSLAR